MATINDIIKDALVQINVVPFDEAPEAAYIDAGLNIFKDMVLEIYGIGLYSNITQKVPTSNPYTAIGNEKLFWNEVTPLSVVLPTLINNKPPTNGMVVDIVGTSQHKWIYIAAKAAWIDILALELATQDPLGVEANSYLKNKLAVRMARRFGYAPGADLLNELEGQERLFKANLLQSVSGQVDPVLNNLRYQR